MRILNEEEIEELFEAQKLNMLADVRIKRRWWAFPFIYTWEFVRDIILLNIETPRAIARAQHELDMREFVGWLEANLEDVTGSESVEQVWALPGHKLRQFKQLKEDSKPCKS